MTGLIFHDIHDLFRELTHRRIVSCPKIACVSNLLEVIQRVRLRCQSPLLLGYSAGRRGLRTSGPTLTQRANFPNPTSGSSAARKSKTRNRKSIGTSSRSPSSLLSSNQELVKLEIISPFRGPISTSSEGQLLARPRASSTNSDVVHLRSQKFQETRNNRSPTRGVWYRRSDTAHLPGEAYDCPSQHSRAAHPTPTCMGSPLPRQPDPFGRYALVCRRAFITLGFLASFGHQVELCAHGRLLVEFGSVVRIGVIFLESSDAYVCMTLLVSFAVADQPDASE